MSLIDPGVGNAVPEHLLLGGDRIPPAVIDIYRPTNNDAYNTKNQGKNRGKAK